PYEDYERRLISSQRAPSVTAGKSREAPHFVSRRPGRLISSQDVLSRTRAGSLAALKTMRSEAFGAFCRIDPVTRGHARSQARGAGRRLWASQYAEVFDRALSEYFGTSVVNPTLYYTAVPSMSRAGRRRNRERSPAPDRPPRLSRNFRR